MKTTSTRNTDIARGRDAYLAEYKANEAKKKAAKATMSQKAREFRKLIRIFFLVACFSAVATMALTFVHLLSEQPLLTPVLTCTGATTVVSASIFFATIVAKKIWKHRLLKLGLMLPPELD